MGSQETEADSEMQLLTEEVRSLPRTQRGEFISSQSRRLKSERVLDAILFYYINSIFGLTTLN